MICNILKSIKFLSNYQSGRSMLEMLGVLAIVGVLSVGGIAGYSKAIEKFKVNKLLGEYNNLIMGLLEHRDSIINNMPGGMYLGNFVSSANIAPANWKLKGIYLEDSFGNSVYPYVEEYADTNGDKKRVGVIVYFNGQTAKGSTDVFSEDLCAEMFSNLIIPTRRKSPCCRGCTSNSKSQGIL